MRIYLDNCCYNRPYDDQSQTLISLETQAKIEIQQKIKDNEILLSSSFIQRYENSQNPYDMRRDSIVSFIDENTSDYVSAERRKEVQAISREIMKTGVKMKDSYHVACAIIEKCDYFLTTDKRLLKYHDERIRICNPIDFIRETEE